MGRIRSSKPEWWKSAKWTRLSRDVRSTYKGIWEVMCDDEGRFLADPRQVKADVWPLDDDITPKKLATWLPKLAEVIVTDSDGVSAPAVVFYEVAGIKYGFLPTFLKHQKISHPTPSKLPKPPSIVSSGSEKTPEDSGTIPENSGAAPENFRPEVEVEEDLDLERDIDFDLEVEEEGEAAAAGEPYAESCTDQLLRRLPSDDARTMWRAEIQASLDGMFGHHKATKEQIEIAARDMIANGKMDRPSLRQFRRYIEGAVERKGKSRASPMERSVANTRAAFGGQR